MNYIATPRTTVTPRVSNPDQRPDPINKPKTRLTPAQMAKRDVEAFRKASGFSRGSLLPASPQDVVNAKRAPRAHASTNLSKVQEALTEPMTIHQLVKKTGLKKVSVTTAIQSMKLKGEAVKTHSVHIDCPSGRGLRETGVWQKVTDENG